MAVKVKANPRSESNRRGVIGEHAARGGTNEPPTAQRYLVEAE